MGAGSSSMQWADGLTAAAPATAAASTKDGLPHLQTTVENQEHLYDLVRMLEQLCVTYPAEAKADFRKPLMWSSSLAPSIFASHATAGHWIVAGKGQRTTVASVAVRSDGQPLFYMESASGADAAATFSARVSSFDCLNRVLQVADEHKLTEMQAIVEANRDPFNNIFGINSDGGKGLVEAFDIYNNEADPRKREQYSRLYKLLLVLNSFDLQLTQSTLKTLHKEKILDIQKVAEELQMLQAFCGREDKFALSLIDWESDYTFSNGYKAPPWRQIYGEISYIRVQCRDREEFIVTASKRGFFINKGYSADDKGNEHLNYESASETYPTLVDLLRGNSPHFDARIDHQEYLYHRENVHGDASGTSAAAAEAGDHALEAGTADDADYGDDNLQASSKDRKAEKEAAAKRNAAAKKKSKNQAKPQHSTEPSLKWRALGLASEDAKSAGKSKLKKGSADKKGRAASSKDPKKRLYRTNSYDGEDYSDSDSAEVSSEEEQQEKRQDSSELPAEYYQIQKLVKYLRSGNQTATIIAICSLRDFDLTNEFNQIAIRDVGGLETLVNLLDTDDPKCKIGALKILKDISQNVQIRSAIADLDGTQPLVELLRDTDEELKCLAAETIAHCAKNARNRRAVRRYGGIRKLVRLLKAKAGTSEELVAISGALALATCSKSSKNKEAIQAAGSIPLLANLLESQNEKLLIPVVGILQECASDEQYRLAIRSSGMIRFLVENLSSNNQELQTHCASAIFKCAEDDETRTLVRQYNGLTPLVSLLDNVANKDLLVAATGAVWKCAQNLDNVAAFNKLNTIKKLVGLMENQPEDVLVNVVGALGACAQTPDGRQGIRESGGITPLVNLLTGTNQALLVNVTTAVGACALDGDSMAVIDRLDGVRLLWSLLKSPNPMVQASAAWAISPCIEHAKDAGEMVRSFVGGLELIVSLLKSDNAEVLASVCAAIANIAKDEENLAVITDHGVVPMLGKLTNTRNDKLRKHLAEAIARCCHWGNNRVAFGSAGAVAPLVKYLKSPDEEVHRSTARALHQLSMDPDNCITMHEHGVVQLLLGMVGSSDPALQEAAAGTIGNIRR
ncbi:armadillo-type protein [Entophlyctis helioformis]|nr:armadillo-type protein [Entophlyctis helioformis]